MIELLIVLLILVVVSGAIYAQIATVQQRGRTEQVELDYMQESRDFVDQFFRDINQIGYPNSRMMDSTSVSWVPALSNPLINDKRLAVATSRFTLFHGRNDRGRFELLWRLECWPAWPLDSPRAGKLKERV